MRASQLVPTRRCPVVCRNDRGDVVRCARWEHHDPPDLHQEYGDIVEQMAQAIAAIRGMDELSDFAIFDCVQQARQWYTRLVVIGEVPSHDTT